MRTVIPPRKPGLKGYADASRLPPAELIARLRDLLGAKLVAYMGSVNETRAVRQWIETARKPSGEVMERLRAAYQVAALLAESDELPVVQAWFQGMNPQLDDYSPAYLLRDRDLDEIGPRVMGAARAFVATAG